jgi:purine-nucleoside phosphorylase
VTAAKGTRTTADITADVAAAVGAICRGACPRIAIILGSGLGGFTRHIERPTRIPFTDLPGVPPATVVGHAGELVHGMVDGQEVVALSGRLHAYEGYAADLLGLPVRIVHALGARTLFVSNAAGAIRPDLAPGSLMLIRDHINLTWGNPLIGPVRPGEQRFPDMSSPYSRSLGDAFVDIARAAGAAVSEGTYAAVLGPSYETRAEIRMLAGMGADAVGMSTVPEVLVARALGMRVTAVSCITNAAAGVGGRLDHADVLASAAAVAPVFERAVREWLRVAARRAETQKVEVEESRK